MNQPDSPRGENDMGDARQDLSIRELYLTCGDGLVRLRTFKRADLGNQSSAVWDPSALTISHFQVTVWGGGQLSCADP